MIELETRVNYVPGDDLRLDLGCGNAKRDGYIGIDMKDFGQAVVWDVRKGLPFPDNSVKEILSNHFIEHISVDDLDYFFHEILRVCKHDAVVYFACPHSSTKEAYYAGHSILWDENRWEGVILGFGKDQRGWMEIESFKVVGIELQANFIVKKH